MTLDEAIHTSRLVIKNLSYSDANGPYKNWVIDPEVNRYLELRHSPPDCEQLGDFIRKMNSSNNNLFLGIFLQDHTHIGNIKLGPIDITNNRGVLGLMIGDKKSWGKGYATEAISAITNYAFAVLKLHRIEAGCYSSNIASYKAFQKAGFETEGVLKEHWFTGDGWEDSILFAKICSNNAAE